MSDTGPAKLPGLPALKTPDQALARWSQIVAEHLEVRAGARGNPLERSVTQRELLNATRGLDALRSDKSAAAQSGDMVIDLGGGLNAVIPIETLAKRIFESAAYKALVQRQG
jgi:hypothetical protein